MIENETKELNEIENLLKQVDGSNNESVKNKKVLPYTISNHHQGVLNKPV